MFLIVGIGNPGDKYLDTRHNIGFQIAQRFGQKHNVEIQTQKFFSFFGKGEVFSQPVILLLPQTFVNLSGKAVQAAISFFHIDYSQTIVIHDDLDLDFGNIRLKFGGGEAGHNGLKSITQCLGSQEYGRLRFGIGKPEHSHSVTDYVLGKFSQTEKTFLDEYITHSILILESAIQNGIHKTMNLFHQKKDLTNQALHS